MEKALSDLEATCERNWELETGIIDAHSQVLACIKLLESYAMSDPELIQRNQAIADWLARGREPDTATEMADKFRISRTTLYKIIKKIEKNTDKAYKP